MRVTVRDLQVNYREKFFWGQASAGPIWKQLWTHQPVMHFLKSTYAAPMLSWHSLENCRCEEVDLHWKLFSVCDSAVHKGFPAESSCGRPSYVLRLCAMNFDWLESSIESGNTLFNRVLLTKSLYDMVPFFTQCFLSVAMSFERFCFICKPHDAASILTKKRQLIAYSLISTLALLFSFGQRFLAWFLRVQSNFLTVKSMLSKMTGFWIAL